MFSSGVNYSFGLYLEPINPSNFAHFTMIGDDQMKEPTRSYALAKAERMYAQCKSHEEKEIIDKYAKLAGCNRLIFTCFGYFNVDDLSDQRNACESRLRAESRDWFDCYDSAP